MKLHSFILTLMLAGAIYHTNAGVWEGSASAGTDSTLIHHTLDGMVKEWPASRFTTDAETGMQFAIDNDQQYLYIALNIPENRLQLKMMSNGMSTYIDVKGKKKEGRGIEFPEKNENAGTLFEKRVPRATDELTEERRKPDMKAIRKTMAQNLVAMRLFGFGKGEELDQQLLLPNSVNIAFAWDTEDVMHIEYVIPLSMLGEPGALDQKEISIGWNIHAFEMPKREGQTAPANGYGGGGYRGGSGGGSMQQMMQAQRFWGKYTVVKN